MQGCWAEIGCYNKDTGEYNKTADRFYAFIWSGGRAFSSKADCEANLLDCSSSSAHSYMGYTDGIAYSEPCNSSGTDDTFW